MFCSPVWRTVAHACPSSRVHVLGLGSIGTFAAHALAEGPKPALTTLMLHRPNLMDSYVVNGSRILLKTRQGATVSSGGYHFETLQEDRWYRMGRNLKALSYPTNDTIEELILCVKSTQTVTALRSLMPRLTPLSTIMFLQNGAGMIEDVNEQLFPDASSRPNYITGVISHGVTLNSPFNITHTGAAATSIGLVLRHQSSRVNDPSGDPPEVSSHMLRALPLVSRFNCTVYQWPDILQIQLEKLAVNAVSNPLCALSDTVTNYVFTIPDVCNALISEISSVAQALPELLNVSGVATRFSPEVLGSTVMKILDQNRETTTSMVWDTRAGRETEIRYINGYWSRRGRELGIPTPINDDLVVRVEARTADLRRAVSAKK